MRFFVLIAGIGLVILGVKECRLASSAKDDPQAITCAQLAEKGPGENVHIVMSDFLLLEQSYVYAERLGTWTEVWIPAVPFGGAYHTEARTRIERDGDNATMPPVTDLRVLVKLTDAKNEAGVSKAGQEETLQGMVINDVDSLDSEERKLLKESYPGIDFDKCWILETGREPGGLGKIILMILGGLVLSLGMIGFWIAGRSKGSAAPETEQSAPSPQEEDA